MLIADRVIDDTRPPIIVFLGTTGSGKTSAAVEMPGAEAICADRFTAWSGMDLGTAKPTSEEQNRMPHHLIDVFHLGELAGHPPEEGFVQLNGRSELPLLRGLAATAIADITEKDRIPVIVGGSASTLKEITLGFVREEDPELRNRLNAASEQDLRRLCESWGFPYFEYLNPLDAIRDKIYDRHTTVDRRPLPNVYPIGIKHDMNHLIGRLQHRLDEMWDTGLPQEVERLVETYGWVRPLTQAIGYKEFMPNPDGTIPRPDEVRRTILANTIGFVWSQSEQFRDMVPVAWATTPQQAIEIGRKVIEQYRTSGLQASRSFYT